MPSRYWDAREKLLASDLMEKQLSFLDVMRIGKSLYNRWNSLMLYGMKPVEWHIRGIRILGRTSIEAHPDGPAHRLGEVTARVFDRRDQGIVDLFDPFLGSGNLTYHLARHLSPRRIVGFEANSAICSLTQRSFALLRKPEKLGDAEILTLNADWTAAARYLRAVPTLIVLAPPWGNAYRGEGLDLRETAPPIPDLLSFFLSFEGPELFFLIPIAGGKTIVDPLSSDARIELMLHHPEKGSGFLLLTKAANSRPTNS